MMIESYEPYASLYTHFYHNSVNDKTQNKSKSKFDVLYRHA